MGRVSARVCRFACFRRQFLAQLLQPPHRLGLQPAIGEFLDPVGEAALEVPAIEGGGSLSNSCRHCSFSFGVGVVFRAASRAST